MRTKAREFAVGVKYSFDALAIGGTYWTEAERASPDRA